MREMSERRRSAAALSSRAHAFSVEALIGSNKKRKLRGWEEKELQLSMESLGADGEDPAHCLDMDPGQSVRPSVNLSVMGRVDPVEPWLSWNSTLSVLHAVYGPGFTVS